MKKVLKILVGIIFSPVMLLMWLVIKLGVAITYVSSLMLNVASGIFALTAVVHLLTDSAMNGIICIVIAFLLSPYGLPTFAVMLLGGVQWIRENLRYAIYG